MVFEDRDLEPDGLGLKAGPDNTNFVSFSVK